MIYWILKTKSTKILIHPCLIRWHPLKRNLYNVGGIDMGKLPQKPRSTKCRLSRSWLCVEVYSGWCACRLFSRLGNHTKQKVGGVSPMRNNQLLQGCKRRDELGRYVFFIFTRSLVSQMHRCNWGNGFNSFFAMRLASSGRFAWCRRFNQQERNCKHVQRSGGNSASSWKKSSVPHVSPSCI